MPSYDYSCDDCKEMFEVFYMTISKYEEEKDSIKCSICGSKNIKRWFGAPRLIFKGSGWTPVYSRDSTGSIKDETVSIKEDLKNIKSDEVYNVTKPRDLG